MTTGRINQVTTFLKPPSNDAEAATVLTNQRQNGASFLDWEFFINQDCIDSTARNGTLSLAVLT
jgi:hypothetical protein